MHSSASTARKRPVNLSLSEGLVAQAKTYTNNLSATMESLLAEFVASQQQAQLTHRQMADACVADWNAVHAAVGSFADEHSTL
jgi:antitoxin CcdA